MSSEEIECGICWRAANLSPAQQSDPANAITGAIRRCAQHQAMEDELWAKFGANIFVKRAAAVTQEAKP